LDRINTIGTGITEIGQDDRNIFTEIGQDKYYRNRGYRDKSEDRQQEQRLNR